MRFFLWINGKLSLSHFKCPSLLLDCHMSGALTPSVKHSRDSGHAFRQRCLSSRVAEAAVSTSHCFLLPDLHPTRTAFVSGVRKAAAGRASCQGRFPEEAFGLSLALRSRPG